MAQRQFNREIRLTVGEPGPDALLIHSQRAVVDGRSIRQGLDVRFDVERDLKREPNTAKIEVFNLNPAHRKQLGEAKNAVVILEAGYEGGIGQIFKGKIRPGRAFSQLDGPDWITVLEAGDGEKATRSNRVSESFPAGTSVRTVLECVVASLSDLQLGNASRKLLQEATSFLVESSNLGSEFVEGTTVSGNAATELTRLLDSVGLEWSVQGEEIQILRKGQALTSTVIKIGSGTGLIGSPEVGSDGVVNFTSLLNPDISPGRRVQLDSRTVDGGVFRVLRVKNTGDIAGPDWFAQCEAKRL